MSTVEALVSISRDLCARVDPVAFGPPVHTTYNPLRYARGPHETWIRRYGEGQRPFLLLGMNPGPFGMGQTGVPFGDIPSVRDFLGIEGPVDALVAHHPKRPIVGFALARREGSGRRLWGWAEERFGTAERFCAQFWVHNHCPLWWVDDGGRNLTPEVLPRAHVDAVLGPSDEALRRVVEALGVRVVFGVGAYAASRARDVVPAGVAVAQILHPSPANPRANRGWAVEIEPVLRAHGVEFAHE